MYADVKDRTGKGVGFKDEDAIYNALWHGVALQRVRVSFVYFCECMFGVALQSH